MKFWTKEQEAAAWDANIKGGIRGAGYSAGIIIPGYLILNKLYPAFKRVPIPLKALGMTVISVPVISFCAEEAGVEYERSQWTGVGKTELDRAEERKRKEWEVMTPGQKFKTWTVEHQWPIVIGSWAGSMAVAGAIVARNKYMTFPQKLVQARMYAQFLTVGVVIGSGVMAGINSQGQKPAEHEDHSWRQILEDQEAEEKRIKDLRNGSPVQATA